MVRPGLYTIKKRRGIFEVIQKFSLRKWLVVVLLLVTLVWGVRLVAINYTGYNYGGWGAPNSSTGYAGYPYYNSDDVAQQNFLWDWQHGLKRGIVVGTDNYFIKYPIYILVNNLPLSPLGQLYLTSYIVLSITASLVLWVYYQLTKLLIKERGRQVIALLSAGLLLSALPIEAFFYIKMPVLRNVEIGIFLYLLLQLFYLDLKKNYLKDHGKLKVAGLLILLSCLLADDPLFVYEALAPVVVVGAISLLTKTRSKRHIGLFGFAVGGYLGSLLIRLLISSIEPVKFYVPKITFANFHAFLTNLGNFFTDGSRLFGINFWSKGSGVVGGLLAFASLTILIIALLCIAHAIKKPHRPLAFSYTGALFLWVPLMLLLTTFYDRYTEFLVFLVPIGIIMAFRYINVIRQAVALLTVSVGITLITIGLVLPGISAAFDSHNKTNSNEFMAIAAIKKTGITKGYANYWHSAIDTFLSGHTLSIIGTGCFGTNLAIPDLLVEHAEVQGLASKSFYLYYPGDSLDCNPHQLVKEFGSPLNVIHTNLAGTPQIIIYNYDIGRKMTLVPLN